MFMGKIIKKITALVLAFSMLAGCSAETLPEVSEPVDKAEENLVDSEKMPEFSVTRGTFSYAGMFNEEKDATAEYVYSDEYFELDSTVYNPSLATMSLCLELSTWSSHNTEVWSEKSQNAKKLLGEIGFENFSQNEFWNEKPSTKSVGIVAANKKLEDSTLIALAVRGGGYYNEWGSNVAVGLSGEHAGFAEGKRNVINFLEEYIEEFDISGKIKIWLVGYSRGGAIANMTAGYLNGNELPNGAELAFEDLYCYLFAPPKGVMESEIGKDENHANIHNIINANDIVPLVAPGNWDFNRYNTTPRLLPTITTAKFEEALAVMLEEYEEVLKGTEIEDPAAAEYGISEYAKKLSITVDPKSFMPSGKPAINIEIVDDTSQTMAEMLGEFILSFADHVHGRKSYYEVIEKDMISLLNDLMGYEAEPGFEEAVNKFISALTDEHYKNLKYVMEPVLDFTKSDREERVDEIIAHLYEVVPQPEGYEDLYGTAASLLGIIGEIIEEDTAKLMDMLLAFADSKLMQAHYPEIMLAWMRSGDPNYTENPFTMKVPEAVRVVRINCPVNVEIHDRNSLVASVTDGICENKSAVIGCAVNEDGEIIIHLPSDEEYSVLTTATGEGEVNITVSEFNVARSSVTRVQNYHNIPVKTGDVLELKLPVIEEKEFFDEEQKGSTADYVLVENGEKEVSSSEESAGEDVKYYNVSVAGGNKFGIVSGGGSYLEGSFAKVSAKPIPGSGFEGWFINGTKVSGSEDYRFAVIGDVDIEARFTETEMYNLTFGVSGKGTVHNVDNKYSEGSVVQISATPAEGYVFDRWAVSSGKIGDAKSQSTTLTVENKDASVTAIFKSIEKTEICPFCGKELKNGESHKAACEKEGHYFCDGKDHLLCNFEKAEGSVSDNKKPEIPSEPENPGEEPDMPEIVGTFCGGCGQQLAQGESHVAECGMLDHYTCDGTDHSQCGGAGALPEEMIVCKVCGESYPLGESHTCPDDYYSEIVCKVCGVSYPLGESHTCAP